MWVFSWPGIHSVQFDGQCQHIVAMCSLEGEVVPLRNLVRISNNVEVIFTIPCVVCGVVAWIVWEVKHLFVVLVLIVCTVCVCVCAKVWLSELSAEMKETLKQMLLECVAAGRKGDVNPARYPSQVGHGNPQGPPRLSRPPASG